MIHKFEKDNKKHDIRINIYGWNNLIDDRRSYIVPIQISKTEAKNTINLLLYKDHYFYIKKLNRILGTWNSNYHYFCENCLIGFKDKLLLEKHRQCCSFFKPTLTLFPSEKHIWFKNLRQMVEFPYVIYSDFECILKKIRKEKSNKTFAYQRHIACGYCLIVVNQDNDVIYKNLYRWLDSAKVFLKDIKSQTEKLLKALLNYKEMNALTKGGKPLYTKEYIDKFLAEHGYSEEHQRKPKPRESKSKALKKGGEILDYEQKWEDFD